MTSHLLLALGLFTTEAKASDPVVQIIEGCEKRYPDAPEAAAWCVTSARFALGEQSDREISDQVAEVKQALDQLVEQQSAVATDATPTSHDADPAQGALFAPVGGVAWTEVPRPFVVSVHNIEKMESDTLRIWGLNTSSARKRCGGEGAPLAVFTNHGVPVTNIWAPEGEPSGFTEVYWDGDGDGIPDPRAVYALDLTTQDDVWVSSGADRDVKVVYIRPSGKIGVTGLPLQTLYRPTNKRDSAGAVVACDMDEIEPRGGHRQVPASAMSRVW